MPKPYVTIVANEGPNGDSRTTGRVVFRADGATRLAIARAFVGRLVDVDVDMHRNGDVKTLRVYAEAAAQLRYSGTTGDLLVTSSGGNLHDLSRFEAIPLAVIRGIATVD